MRRVKFLKKMFIKSGSKKLYLSVVLSAVILNGVFAQGSFFALSLTGGANFSSGTITQLNPVNGNVIKRIDLQSTYTGDSFYGNLVLVNSKYYALGNSGGSNNLGVILEYEPYAGTTSIKFNFDGANNGSRPKASMTHYQNKLYGVTSDGGLNDAGVLFEYDYASNQYTKKIDFSAAIGKYPQGTMAVFGSKLYGLCWSGGTNDMGTLFSYAPATGVITKLQDLNVGVGTYPVGALIVYNDKLYGTTQEGGANTYGTLIEYDTLTNTLTNKVNFTGIGNGRKPTSSLVVLNSKLYGTTREGGSSNQGSLFEYEPSSGILTTKFSFATGGVYGGLPLSALTVLGNKLYGTTSSGAANTKGAFFEYDPSADVMVNKFSIENVVGEGWNYYSSLSYLPYITTHTISGWKDTTVVYNTPIQLAPLSSGPPIVFKSSNNAIANIDISTAMVYPNNIGVVTMKASIAGTASYGPVDSVIQVMVIKRTLDVHIDNAQRLSCASNPVFTAEYSNFGFEDELSQINVLPVFSSYTGSVTGTFPITGSGGSDDRYDFNIIPGTLTVVDDFELPAIIGKNSVGTGNNVSFSIEPANSSFSYQWYYTGSNIEVIGDSIYKLYNVSVKKNATAGEIVCIVTHCGDKDTIKKAITINAKPTLVNFLTDVTCGIKRTYCDSSYLSYFKVENMFQTPVTGCSPSGYSDYTDSEFTGTLYLGEAYTINLEAGGFPGYFGLWIDYNNDGDFGGPQEMLSANFDAGFQYIVPNIVIPNLESYKGPRRMRIRTRLSKPFTSDEYCQEEGSIGETEDYLIYLDVRPALEAPNVITPNEDGLNDLFVIRGINAQKENSLLIIDRMGKLVYETDNYQNSWPAPGTNLKNGVYYYIFKNGDNEIKSYLEISN